MLKPTPPNKPWGKCFNVRSDPTFKEAILDGDYVNFIYDAKLRASQLLMPIEIPKTSSKILLEYCQPNSHKNIHLGHVRNIVLGGSIARMLEAVGTGVIKY